MERFAAICGGTSMAVGRRCWAGRPVPGTHYGEHPGAGSLVCNFCNTIIAALIEVASGVCAGSLSIWIDLSVGNGKRDRDPLFIV